MGEKAKKVDFYVGSNNGVVALWPAPGGRFEHLVQKRTLCPRPGTPLEYHRCWVFKDYHNDKDTFDYQARGLVAGTRDDLRRFSALCKGLGLHVWHGGLGTGFVPLSNGRSIIAETLGNQSFWGYTDIEVALCRIDLPTEEDLRQASER